MGFGYVDLLPAFSQGILLLVGTENEWEFVGAGNDFMAYGLFSCLVGADPLLR